MTLAVCEHDSAWPHQLSALAQHRQICLGESRTIHQQITATAVGRRRQQPAAAPLAIAAGGEKPQTWAHLLGRPAGFGGVGQLGQLNNGGAGK